MSATENKAVLDESEELEETVQNLDEVAEEGADTPETSDGADNNDELEEEDETSVSSDSRAKRDAAKYRTQLREVEAERDTLKAQVEGMQKDRIEEVLSDVLVKPAAFWLGDITPAQFFDKDGRLDQEALKQAAQNIANEIGLAKVNRFKGSADGGPRGFGESGGAARRASWSDALNR